MSRIVIVVDDLGLAWDDAIGKGKHASGCEEEKEKGRNFHVLRQ